MRTRVVPEKFLVAFSYAREQQPLVRAIAEVLEAQLGGDTVFYDEWFEFYIAGPDADKRLQDIYRTRSELVLECISPEYGRKPWPMAEDEAIRSRIHLARVSKDPRDLASIMHLQVGPGDVSWLPFTTATVDVTGRAPSETANLIVNKLCLVRPDVKVRQAASSERLVYLAECTPDLEDLEKPINRTAIKTFLEERGFTVLPNQAYGEQDYVLRLEEDLKRSLAFVQLRGPYPWKRGRYDRLQNDIAERLSVERFIYRSSDINLEKVDPDHRPFLTAPGVIADGFDDFLHYLDKQLTKTVRQKERREEFNRDKRPLVRVVTRSANPDVLWDQMFQWIYEEEQILSELLEPGESFELQHEAEPCHGFVVVCDAAALEDGPLSPRDDIRQCRRIQLHEKEQDKRPPVAVVYWRPPEPSWSKLLHVQPPKLYRAAPDQLPMPAVPRELSEFFKEVRRIAQ